MLVKRVVITGVGAVTPIGGDVAAFWDGLCQGRCGIGPITRFDAAGFKVGLAAEVKDFSPERYGIDRGEARRMDLYTQFAMAAAAQAAQDSGVEGAFQPQRLGVYVGSGIGGMTTFMAEHEKLLSRGPGRVSPLFIPMMIANIAAGNIAIRYGAKGPCLPVVTACATSTHTVGEAYRAIRYGYADGILAGGAEATVNALAVAGFTNMKALTEAQDPQAASLPFDRRRAGFVMGEGAGILVLEELEHALKRGAKIYCEVVGYGNTCDAHHITAPDPQAEGGAQAIALALQEAGGLESPLYINAHGTGTPLNDSAETLAIKKALGEDGARRAYISSTKSMTGHMLGAAGAVELIASALALKEGLLPPTIHLEQPDPDCDLNYLPGSAAHPIQCADALSVSLGFGGHNGAVALRRYA
ncbi:MAG TPA: beta-ketoacyl-ACP synthase II [Candidatus Excrementavichristensenella intestinipullorum]|nr:beta-ketoacyl-ACP synthase II [Candidatus Excrementavichristensenella intestinipullorum]